MIHNKSPQDIQFMQEGGVILSDVLRTVLGAVSEGVTLSSLDVLAEREIRSRGASPSFQRVKGYRWSICVCVNDVVVHGIPTSYRVRDGDVVSIDCGVYYKGFHTDAAWTVRVGRRAPDSPSDTVDAFLSCGRAALLAGISCVAPGKRIFDISHRIQHTVEGSGYGIVRSLVGHGIGKALHEDPEVPNFVNAPREQTPELAVGMTLAIEVIYTLGNPSVRYKNDDGWTICTEDGKIAALFEATVAVSSRGCLVLTRAYAEDGKS